MRQKRRQDDGHIACRLHYFPEMLHTRMRLAAFHIAGAATGTDFDDRTGVQQ